MNRKTRLSLCVIAALGAAAVAGIGGIGLYRVWRERIAIGGLHDIDSRSAAVESLWQSRSKRSVPHLVALLDDEDGGFRQEVFQALEGIGLDRNPEAIAEAIIGCADATDELKELLRVCVEQCRGFVPALVSGAALHCDWMSKRGMSGGCDAVFDFLSGHPEVTLDHLQPCLEENPARAMLALEIIGRIGRPADKLCSDVVRLLRHEDAGIATGAGYALVEMECCGEDLCDSIAAAARDPQTSGKDWIADLMGKPCAPCREMYIAALRGLTRDEYSGARIFAVLSIGSQRCIADLEKEMSYLLANDPSKDIRVTCVQVILEAREEERFVDCVEAALPGASGVVQYALATLLYKARPSSELRQLVEEASKCGNNEVRKMARELLESSTR